MLNDGSKLMKYGRDFMTPALIEQSMSSAIDQLAFTAEMSGDQRLKLTADLLIECLHQQIESVADNVTRYNIDDF